MADPQPTMGAHINFLAQLPDVDKNELYRLGKTRSYAKNDFIFTAGEIDINICVLRHGRVKIFSSSAEGRDSLLWFSLEGEIFCLAECLQNQPRLISAQAIVPCEVLFIDRSKFAAWLVGRPETAISLLKIMAQRILDIGQRFLSLANGNVQREIAQLFIHLGNTHGVLVGEHIQIGIPLTEQDIADMVGSRRQGVSTCLAEMKRNEIVDIVRHFVILKKPEELQKIVGMASSEMTIERRAITIERRAKERRAALLCSND